MNTPRSGRRTTGTPPKPRSTRRGCARSALVNPLKEYALEEIARCARTPGLHYGLKLHFGNSDVRTDSARQLDLLKRVFKAANDARMAIIVHMHANINNHRPYGAEQGRTFLEQLLPQAPDVPVQIAHLADAGGANDIPADSALGVFAACASRGATLA